MRISQLKYFPSVLALLVFLSGQAALAQFGKLVIKVAPANAYVFADGAPVVDNLHHFIVLPAGEHKIDLYNYGYKPESRSVNIEAHRTVRIEVTLQPDSKTVAGPWGCITLEGADRDAVLLNGKDPAFFVGHGDEFNNEWIWKQELVVPPGKYELTVLTNMNRPPQTWTTTVDVPENQRVVVDAYKGVRKTVPWSRGQQLQSLPRFKAGTASAEVAVQKVTGQFAAASTQVKCGDSTQLTWSSDGAAKTEISGIGPVGASGQQTVQPKQSTDYKFTAAGPGGVYTSDANVAVNTAVDASLNMSPAEVRYHKIGEKVDQQGSATLNWSAANADTVSVDPLGSVGASGSRTIDAVPEKTALGPVDETRTYTLHASNACGGSETKTATLHIVGSIDPLQAAVSEQTLETRLTFNSVYFPYNQPTKANPEGGLVPSQERRMEELVTNFKQYLTYRPEAHLILEAHADHRGTSEYNQALTQRRADRVKAYLIDHGISAGAIETKAFGKEKNLTSEQVLDLTYKNPNITDQDKERVKRDIEKFRMANNRRVDVRLSTTGQASLQFYPYNSEDLNVLIGEAKPEAKKSPAKAPAAKKAPAKK